MESDAAAGLGAGPLAPGRLRAALTASRPVDYRRASVGLALIVLGTSLLMTSGRVPLQLFCGHDAIGFLASAWRVRCGQMPHADFHTAPGALNACFHAGAMWLLGPTAAVLPFCGALFGVAVGTMGWCVARRRLPAIPAACFALTVAWVAMAPHLMRFVWYVSTYDGYYNRQSYALLTVVMLALFLPARAGARRWADDATVGAALGALLFIKVSYFMAGCGFCGLALALGDRFERKIPWALATGFGAVFALCLPLIRFDLGAMLADLRMAAAARTALPETAVTWAAWSRWLASAPVEIALLAAMQLLQRAPLGFRRPGNLTPSWAEFAGLVALNAFLCTTNSPAGDRSETPLLSSWLFVLLGGALRAPGRLTLPVTGVLSGVLWMFTFSAGAVCLYWASSPWPTDFQRRMAALSPPFDVKPLAALPVLGDSDERGLPVTYAEKVNDGVRLLRRLGGVHRVADLDFVNPFPFALQWPPARGDLWCWDNGFSFSESSHPSPEETFGDADVLLIPKFPGAVSFAVQRHLYGDYIKAHFQLTGESGCWYVLQRQ